MEILLRYAGVVACALVLAGCICRIGLMQSRRNRFSWWLIYASLSAYALGVGLDLLTGRYVDWYEICGIGGILLYLERTRGQWRDGPPTETRTDLGGLHKADGQRARHE